MKVRNKRLFTLFEKKNGRWTKVSKYRFTLSTAAYYWSERFTSENVGRFKIDSVKNA